MRDLLFLTGNTKIRSFQHSTRVILKGFLITKKCEGLWIVHKVFQQSFEDVNNLQAL